MNTILDLQNLESEQTEHSPSEDEVFSLSTLSGVCRTIGMI